MVVAIVGVLAGVAIGVTPSIVQKAKGQSGAAQVTAFLKRFRELAISHRRNIEIRFVGEDQIEAAERAVPQEGVETPEPTVLETQTFEGGIRYFQFEGQPDTPDAFGNAAAVTVGGVAYATFTSGTNRMMFTSEGSLTDANGDAVNATILLGVPGRAETATAITLLGTTATVRAWQFDGSRWVH